MRDCALGNFCASVRYNKNCVHIATRDHVPPEDATIFLRVAGLSHLQYR